MRRSWCSLLILATCLALPACVVSAGPGYYRRGYGYRPYGHWGYGRTVIIDRYPDIGIDRPDIGYPEAVPLPEPPPPMPEAMPLPDMGMPDFGPGDLGDFDLGDF